MQTMSSFFEHNLAALSASGRNAEAVQSLLQMQPSQPLNLQIQETQAGDLSLILEGVPLHALSGAVNEAKALCDKECHPNEKATHIIVGLGLGYVLTEVLSRSMGKVFIYEPNPELLRLLLDNVDYTNAFAQGRVHLALSPEQLARQLDHFYTLSEHLDVLVLRGIVAIYGAAIDHLLTHTVAAVIEHRRTSLHVAESFHTAWFSQCLSNTVFLHHALPFSQLNATFTGQTAVIASSGPSLDKALEDLKTLQDRVIIFAVPGAVRPLLAAGIKPHFMVALDFEGPGKYLSQLPGPLSDTRFLLSPFVEAACYQVPAAAYYVQSYTNYPSLSRWNTDIFGVSDDGFPSGSTVSLTAFQSALAMGFEQLILVGQDLALSGTQYYAGGVHGTIDEDGYISLQESETMVSRRIKVVEVLGQNGGMIPSMPDYKWFVAQFEEAVLALKQSRPELRLYNASTGGALIQGFEHQSLAEIIQSEAWENGCGDSLLPLQDILNRISQQEQAKMMPEACASRKQVISSHLSQLNNDMDGLGKSFEALENEATSLLNHLDGVAPGDIARERIVRYLQGKKKLEADIQLNPLLYYAIQMEVLHLYQHTVLVDPQSPDEAQLRAKLREALVEDSRFYQSSREIFHHTVEPILKRLKQTPTGVTS
ncbi:MAG: DUF115 domain-containing protein [Cyanobacteria bacterium]|nr:DUF115 domain-containing protein [Cyanobacteriota bacterium]